MHHPVNPNVKLLEGAFYGGDPHPHFEWMRENADADDVLARRPPEADHDVEPLARRRARREPRERDEPREPPAVDDRHPADADAGHRCRPAPPPPIFNARNGHNSPTRFPEEAQ